MNKKILIACMTVAALLVPAVATAQQMSSQERQVWRDVTRLQAILIDAQSNVDFSASVWTVVANEANALANRVYSSTRGWRSESAQAANDLRMHVRELHSAATRGDESGAKRHAAEGLPFANTLAGRITM